MKPHYPSCILLLLTFLWTSCESPKDFLQGNTWVLYEHNYINPSQQEEIKDTYTLSERKLVLSFGEKTVNWIEDGRPMLGEYEMLDSGYLQMLGHNFRISRLGELTMVLEKEDSESLSHYFFMPEDCICWEE